MKKQKGPPAQGSPSPAAPKARASSPQGEDGVVAAASRLQTHGIQPAPWMVMAPRFCLYTFHSPEYTPLASITEANKRAYAARHGYDFRGDLASHANAPLGEIAYGRMQAILQVMERSRMGPEDYIFSTGCDSMITNPDTTLASIAALDPAADLIVATDGNGWNSDSFLIKCTDASKAFLREIMKWQQENRGATYGEQSAMAALKAMVKHFEAPQRTMNSYNVVAGDELGSAMVARKDQAVEKIAWQPGDFLIHWVATPLALRIELAMDMAAALTGAPVAAPTSESLLAVTDMVVEIARSLPGGIFNRESLLNAIPPAWSAEKTYRFRTGLAQALHMLHGKAQRIEGGYQLV